MSGDWNYVFLAYSVTLLLLASFILQSFIAYLNAKKRVSEPELEAKEISDHQPSEIKLETIEPDAST